MSFNSARKREKIQSERSRTRAFCLISTRSISQLSKRESVTKMSIAALRQAVPSETISDWKTKIVCTLGPASNTEPVLQSMVEAGMDCVRMNFSHGKEKEMRDLFALVRSIGSKNEERVSFLFPNPNCDPLTSTNRSSNHRLRFCVTSKVLRSAQG